VQQSAKIEQSLSLVHSGSVDSAAASSSALGLDDSDFVAAAVDSGLTSDFAAGSPAAAGVSEAFPEPPQAASNNAGTTTQICLKQFMRVQLQQIAPVDQIL